MILKFCLLSLLDQAIQQTKIKFIIIPYIKMIIMINLIILLDPENKQLRSKIIKNYVVIKINTPTNP